MIYPICLAIQILQCLIYKVLFFVILITKKYHLFRCLFIFYYYLCSVDKESKAMNRIMQFNTQSDTNLELVGGSHFLIAFDF